MRKGSLATRRSRTRVCSGAEPALDCGRKSPVRFIGVRVKIDQRRLDLNAPV